MTTDLRTDVFVMPPDRSEDAVRFGGDSFFRPRPNYEVSYLLGAQLLFRTASETDLLPEAATPLLFLHRHCAELILKKALYSARCLMDEYNEIAEKSGDAPSYTVGKKGQEILTGCHDLLKIRDRLEVELRELGKDCDGAWSIPASMTELSTQLAGDETGFEQKGVIHRYHNVRSGHSLEDFRNAAREFPVRERQKLLERAAEEMIGSPTEDLWSPSSLVGQLELERYAVDQQLLRFIGPEGA